MVTMVTVFRGAALRGPLQMSLRVERHARQPDPIGLHSRMVAWPMVGLVTMFRGSLLAFLLEQVQREARVRSSGELVKKDRQGGALAQPRKISSRPSPSSPPWNLCPIVGDDPGDDDGLQDRHGPSRRCCSKSGCHQRMLSLPPVSSPCVRWPGVLDPLGQWSAYRFDVAVVWGTDRGAPVTLCPMT